MAGNTTRFYTEAELVEFLELIQKTPKYVNTVMLDTETAITFQGGKTPHWYVKGCMENQKNREVIKKNAADRLRLKLLKKKLTLTQ
jgi:hypothetical protein